MSTRRRYATSDALLHTESNLIITACEASAPVTARLPAGAPATARQLLDDALQAVADQSNNVTELSGLTTAQNTALATIKLKIKLGRATARKAFRTDPTKLREQFGVGTVPQSLAATTALALKIHAGATDPDNLAGMTAKAWTPTDSTELHDAILTLTGADTIQEARKAINKGDTLDYVQLNNDLYDAVTTIQNAARIQHATETPANIVARQTFRIGLFPPIVNEAPPTKPKKFTAKPKAPGTLQIYFNWNISTRADDYLLTLKNKTTGDVILTYPTAENNALLTLTGTPAGTEIEATIVARNELGPSPEAGPITAVVP